MKTIFKIYIVTFIIISIFITPSCLVDKPTLPEIITLNVTEITSTTATSGGNVTNLGEACKQEVTMY